MSVGAWDLGKKRLENGENHDTTDSKTLLYSRGDIRSLHAIVQRRVCRDGQGDFPRVA